MSNITKQFKKKQKFLCFISFECSFIPRKPHFSYSPLLTIIISLEILERWLQLLYLLFVFVLIVIFVRSINCPLFLSRYSFNVRTTRSTRTKNSFHISTEVNNYSSNTKLNLHNRIMKTIDELNIDLFISPSFHFKTCNFILHNS